MIAIFTAITLTVTTTVDSKTFECGHGGLLDRISVMDRRLDEEPLVNQILDSTGRSWWVDNANRTYVKAFDQCLEKIYNEADLASLNAAEYHALLRSLYSVGYMSEIDTTSYMSEVIEAVEMPSTQQYIAWRDQIAIKHWNPDVSLEDPGVTQLVAAMSKAQGDRVGVILRDFSQVVSINPPEDGILVISSPGCAPSRRFFNWTSAIEDEKLLESIVKNFTGLHKQNGNLRLSALSSWQASLPIDVILVRSSLDWPEIVDWATPTFYFYRGGEVVRQIAGWPEGGREKELREAMLEFGFLVE